MIRAGKFSDIPAIRDIIVAGHHRSVYAGLCEVDLTELNAVLVQAMQRNGGVNDGGTMVAVAEVNDRIVGFIIGCLQRVYHVGTKLMATDLFFLAEHAAPGDAWKDLLGELEAWAAKAKVVEIQLGTTGALVSWELVGKLYERRGYSRFGGIYVKRLA